MVTVLMATRNRAAQLGQVLMRYCELRSPPGGWKAVIVDNASSDDTQGVVQGFVSRIPVEYLREDHAGKSVALNTGIAAVVGELVVLTDDDVLVPSDWLVRYQTEAATRNDFSIFAGPVAPKWPGPPPSWIGSNWGFDRGGETLKPAGPVFGLSTRVFETGPVSYRDAMGANFAVRASVFKQGLRFDPNSGPSNKCFAMGSDTEFLQRLVNAGHRVWWLADLGVEHVIRPEQLKRSWIWRRTIRIGRGVYRQTVYQNGVPAFLFGAPRYVIRQLGEEGLRAAVATVTRRREERLAAIWMLAFNWGRLLEGRQMRKLDQG